MRANLATSPLASGSVVPRPTSQAGVGAAHSLGGCRFGLDDTLLNDLQQQWMQAHRRTEMKIDVGMFASRGQQFAGQVVFGMSCRQ